jgi:hypothetical protein
MKTNDNSLPLPRSKPDVWHHSPYQDEADTLCRHESTQYLTGPGSDVPLEAERDTTEGFSQPCRTYTAADEIPCTIP